MLGSHSRLKNNDNVTISIFLFTQIQPTASLMELFGLAWDLCYKQSRGREAGGHCVPPMNLPKEFCLLGQFLNQICKLKSEWGVCVYTHIWKSYPDESGLTNTLLDQKKKQFAESAKSHLQKLQTPGKECRFWFVKLTGREGTLSFVTPSGSQSTGPAVNHRENPLVLPGFPSPSPRSRRQKSFFLSPIFR